MKTQAHQPDTIIWEGTTICLNLSNNQVQQRVKAQIAAANNLFLKTNAKRPVTTNIQIPS